MKNKLGIFYTYYPFESTVEWTRCVRRAAQAGADSIEVSAMRLVKEPVEVQESIVHAAEESGIALSFTSGLPEGCDAASDDPAERQRALGFIRENLALVQRMGGHQVGAVWHGRSHPQPGRLAARERRLEQAAQTLREAGKMAGDYGVILCDEAVNRFEHEMINTVEEELQFLERVDSPHVLALLDSFHMNIEEDDIPKAILRAAGRIGHMHLAENNRKLPGFGHLDWDAILAAIRASGYEGFLTMESFTTPFAAISEGMCIWRDMTERGPDEDAAKAVTFLKEKMNKI